MRKKSENKRRTEVGENGERERRCDKKESKYEQRKVLGERELRKRFNHNTNVKRKAYNIQEKRV